MLFIDPGGGGDGAVSEVRWVGLFVAYGLTEWNFRMIFMAVVGTEVQVVMHMTKSAYL